MGNEINTVIDNLCEKLGVTIDSLVPEFAKYNVAMFACGICICIAVIIIIQIFFQKLKKTEDYEFDSTPYIIGNAALTIVAAIVLVCLAVQLVGWLASPTAATIGKLMAVVVH